jgi:transposase-like protein
LRAFRKPHCGSIRIDKHGTPLDFLLTVKRDLEAVKRSFRKMLKDRPLLAPDRIGTDGAGPYPPAIVAVRKEGLLPHEPLHYCPGSEPVRQKGPVEEERVASPSSPIQERRWDNNPSR